MNLEIETRNAMRKIPLGTVAEQSNLFGLSQNEPLTVAMDGMLRYAKAHHKRYGSKLENDYVLGPEWLKVATGLRGLLNGNGAVAMERDVSTDSKDNGVLEEVFWAAMKAAGFEEKDI